MHAGPVTPSGVERTFGTDELIVSKTDTKGVITYANDVFLRLSAYPEDEVIGRPHNLIRHPDMPRVVFKLLWDTLKDRQEIFAYIVNLAGDGAHYWVLAHVTPSFDTSGQVVGYHSNRRLPDRDAVAATTALYADLRAAERRHSRPADAIEASTALLNRKLADRGQTFDQFVWSMTSESVGA
jgi:PAS domain S-box-containing protein